jgi:hypothetical protein
LVQDSFESEADSESLASALFGGQDVRMRAGPVTLSEIFFETKIMVISSRICGGQWPMRHGARRNATAARA